MNFTVVSSHIETLRMYEESLRQMSKEMVLFEGNWQYGII